MPNAFLDTNIIIYAATAKTHEPGKHVIAKKLLDEADFGISVQTLAEFYAVVRKPAFNMSVEQANQWVANLLEFECAVVDADIFFTGSRLSERYGIQYFDGALLAAARRLGAKTFYTEDLNHGQTYGSVTAINPFLET